MQKSARILPLEPKGYTPHALHHPERAWPETNCYVDLWIEVLNAFGYEPRAALAFCLEMDFEGDQWTFFKFPLQDLSALYGIEVQEMAVWRPLQEHVLEHVGQGRLLIVEMDSHYMPDTTGTAYRNEHVKTSIGIQHIDAGAERLGYFHNAGYYGLEGEDYRGVFRHLEALKDPNILPPYVEMVKFNPERALKGTALYAEALKRVRQRLHRAPKQNPFRPFRARFKEDVAWLHTQPIATYHLYAFNTLRQVGAAFELASSQLDWLHTQVQGEWKVAQQAFADIAALSKSLMFQLARSVNRKKPLDAEASFDAFEQHWERGMACLTAQFR
ncbi:MAG: DUF1839 family protein [Myxococcaceae bacterium]|nr:DUF1839 family protein [Myxococcaceae bacterium]